MDIGKIERTVAEVSKTLGWSVDKRMAVAVANFYLIHGKEFDSKGHMESSKAIKKTEGWTSPLKSYMHHIAAAFLTLQEEAPEEGLKKINARQDELNAAGFRRSPYTYIAAMIVQHPGEAEKAKRLHEEMKQHHKFLTSQEDIPYAVLLGRLEGDVKERAATMNAYYKDLREHGFYMGNDLQWLSQIMTFNSPIYRPDVVGRVVAIRDFFQNEKLKIRGAQYPILGILAVAEANGQALKGIIENTRQLEKTKSFKWYKDLAFTTAVQFAMKDMVETQEMSAVSVSTSLEMLMQAQQAAMYSSINAAIIASSSNNGS
ncbi:DUF4003 family protein [Planococcus ruber]|uniref:DUF4003 family protein n=1 Tax=Planococcus ruber TaxID=2027871 RepID=UPI001FEE94D1|nr:DUF4003 family protein [Planococcus ruber]MCJ1909486.1 DUF4003 domain-containing protein [Planococcus ruber]